MQTDLQLYHDALETISHLSRILTEMTSIMDQNGTECLVRSTSVCITITTHLIQYIQWLSSYSSLIFLLMLLSYLIL